MRPQAPLMRLAALALVASAAACGRGEAPAGKQPHVVLVTLDTTRRDHLSTYGYQRETSPFLTRIAGMGTRFDNAISPATWTLPAHVSMLTGLDPFEHGCWPMLADDEDMRGVAEDTRLLTEELGERGYLCMAAVGGPFPTSRYGVLRGFGQRFEPTGDPPQFSGAEINAWLAPRIAAGSAREAPLFLFVNYFDAHSPYDAPRDLEYPFEPNLRELESVGNLEGLTFASEEEERGVMAMAIDQYDRELFVQDRALGELWSMLEAAGYLENCLVIITSDHGEMFGEQPGTYGHGCAPFAPVANVPLVIYTSGQSPAVILDPVSTKDIASTVLAVLGGEGNAAFPGANLLFEAATVPAPFSEHHGADDWFGVVHTRAGKFAAPIEIAPTGLMAPTGYFIDRAANPNEILEEAVMDPAHPGYAAGRDALNRTLAEWRRPPLVFPVIELNEGELRFLGDLGYGD